MSLARLSAIAGCLLGITFLIVCGISASAAAPAEPADAKKPAESQSFKLGDLVEPFTPPSLAELDKSADWQDMPVVDAMAELRDQKKKEPPLVSIAKALRMRNDSPEANKKILSALSVVPPPDGKGVNFNATIGRCEIMDLASTNPLLANSFAEFEFTDLTGFGLFNFDWNMVPFAAADSVVSWKTSKDHLEDKVIIRDDLVWSDGKPITAHDVAFSFKAIMSSKVPVPAVRAGTDQLKWVEAYDDHTLVYFHKAAQATGVWDVNFPIIPKHIFEKSIAEDPTLTTSAYHTQQQLHPIVGGPYELVNWNRGSDLLLRRRDSYFMYNGKQVRDKPYFKEVRFNILEDGNTRLLALKSGRIQESEIEAEQWQTQTSGPDYYDNNTKAFGNEWLYMYIGWNLKTPFFADVRVRQAMACTMNYDEMINDLCYGLYPRCHGIFAPDAWMYPKKPLPLYEQNLDKAEKLLDEAGWVDTDGDGIRDKEVNGVRIPFEFNLTVSQKPDRIDICNLFRENLDSIGVICHVVPMEAAVFQQRVQNKKYEAEMAGWGTGTDPYLTKDLFGTGEERNWGSYSNPKVDELYKAGLVEFDRQKRAEIYGKIANLIYADQPYLFLYNQNRFFGFSKMLRGYRFSPRGPYGYAPGFSSLWMP
jgi:peptide/nickel transport system substrate-binding protein